MNDLHARAEERRMIFTNVANGVPMEQIRATFLVSDEDIMRVVDFVGSKIREYRFRRRLPPLLCDTIKEIRWNRPALLENLGKLGPEYLASELVIPKIAVQGISGENELREAARETRVRING